MDGLRRVERFLRVPRPKNTAPAYVSRNYSSSMAMLGNGPARPNVEAQMQTMGAVSTVFAIVDAISDSPARS